MTDFNISSVRLKSPQDSEPFFSSLLGIEYSFATRGRWRLQSIRDLFFAYRWTTLRTQWVGRERYRRQRE